MSAPHFAWAFDQGRKLNLPPSERLVLMVMAERANGVRECWPSLPCLATDTGLSPRTVWTVVHSLVEQDLISLKETKGKVTHYRINRPADRVEPLQPLQGLPTDPCNSCETTLATIASESLKENPLSKKEEEEATLPCRIDPCREVLDAWNSMAKKNGLPVARELTPSRRKHLSARLREFGVPRLLEGIDSIGRAAFCRGDNDRGWKADFDFFLRPDRCSRACDGGYETIKTKGGLNPTRLTGFAAAAYRDYVGNQDDPPPQSSLLEIPYG